jgi:hypothetical protein
MGRREKQVNEKNKHLSDAAEAVIRVDHKLHDEMSSERVLVHRADLTTIVEALIESWERLAEWEEFRERLDVVSEKNKH